MGLTQRFGKTYCHRHGRSAATIPPLPHRTLRRTGVEVMTLRSTTSQTTRRTLLAGSLALASTAALSSCGVGGGAASRDEDGLTLLVEAGGHGQLQPIAEQFEKDTGTSVSFVELPYDGLYNRLSSEFTGNAVSFDIAALDSIWLPAFHTALTPLDDLFTQEVKDDLFPALVEEAAVDGSFVGMPAWTN